MDALEIKVKDTFGTDPGHVTNEQIYVALLELVKEEAEKRARRNSTIFLLSFLSENSSPTT